VLKVGVDSSFPNVRIPRFFGVNGQNWCLIKFFGIFFLPLQVLVHLRFTEVPAQYVLKRWTVGIRDVLPTHLVYQKYQGLMTSFSFRHSQLYLNCIEVARLGDVNVDAYTMAMDFIKVLVPKLKKVAVQGDGLGLEERLAAKKARVDGAAAQMVVQYQLYFFLRAWICVTASTNTWLENGNLVQCRAGHFNRACHLQ
jgi:hypothetical protein